MHFQASIHLWLISCLTELCIRFATKTHFRRPLFLKTYFFCCFSALLYGVNTTSHTISGKYRPNQGYRPGIDHLGPRSIFLFLFLLTDFLSLFPDFFSLFCMQLTLATPLSGPILRHISGHTGRASTCCVIILHLVFLFPKIKARPSDHINGQPHYQRYLAGAIGPVTELISTAPAL